VTIGLLGDSTVAKQYGWGPAFASLFNEKVTVLNYAQNGKRLNSPPMLANLTKLIGKKPNYVLIQFGHNDMKRYGTDVYAEKLKD